MSQFLTVIFYGLTLRVARLDVEHFRGATMVVLLLGLTYGGFLGNLALDGQVPSFTRGLPVSADEFYSLASYYVAPLFVVLTGMMATLAWRWGRTTGVSWHQSWTVVAAAYTVPILCTYVLPEWVMYVASGGRFESLTQVTRFAAPTVASHYAQHDPCCPQHMAPDLGSVCHSHSRPRTCSGGTTGRTHSVIRLP